MIRKVLVLLACTLMIPAPAAAGPLPEEGLAGDLFVDARYVYGIVPCEEEVLAYLTSTSRGASVPERAQFVLEMRSSMCGPRMLSFEGTLEGDGSWRLGDGTTMHGTLRLVDEEAFQWSFRLVASTCPPYAICEFPLGQVSYAGTLGGLVTTQ